MSAPFAANDHFALTWKAEMGRYRQIDLPPTMAAIR
jgi:hypothetical protein